MFLKKFEMPDLIEIVPNIPLTQNGKTDFNALLKISRYKTGFDKNLRPEEIFQHLFSKYFGFSLIQLKNLENSSFLDFGGNSILAIQIISELEKYIENNQLTGELLGYLLNKNVSYKSCCDYVREQLCNTNKHLKRKIFEVIEENDKNDKCLKNDNFSYELEVRWKYDMSACIDANPVLVHHPK